MKKLLLTLTIIAVTSSLYGMEPQEQLSPISLAQTYHQFLQSDLKLLPDITQQIFSFHLGGVNLAELPHTIEQSCKNSFDLVSYINKLLDSCGYELASELFERYFSHAKISMCDIKDGHNQTPLRYAISKVERTEERNTEIVKMLIRTAGHNACKLLTMKSVRSETALHEAAYNGQTEIVKLLLGAAGDSVWALLTMKDTFGKRILHQTAHNGQIEIAKLLLNAAGDNVSTLVTIRNNMGRTALHSAAGKGHTEIVKLFLNAAGNNAQDFIAIPNVFGKTAFDEATPEVKEIMQTYLYQNNQ